MWCAARLKPAARVREGRDRLAGRVARAAIPPPFSTRMALRRSTMASASRSNPMLPSGSVAVIAAKAAVIAMRIMGSGA
jgi:hypothetical protein